MVQHKMQGVSKKRFTTVFQMLLCGKCYKNVNVLVTLATQ
jgi:hypothetical protein